MKITVLAAAASAAVWSAGCDARQIERADAEYVVRFDQASFPTAHVQARLHVIDGAVTMSSFWASFFDDPRGWAAHVEIVSATSADGAELTVTPTETYGWTLGDGYSGVADIAYDVDYSFAERRWDAGNEQVALRDGGALFTTGLPLFLHAPETATATVRFELPDAFGASTSWPKSDGVYAVEGLDRLLRNAIVVGDHFHDELKTRNVELRIALVGDIAKSAERVTAVGAELLGYYVDLFDERDDAQFLMTVIPGPNDGEGYFDSFASSQPTAPGEDDVIVWANSLAHEFFHYWNGKKFSSSWENRSERQWFSEGFSEYFANVALRDLGVIDARAYDELLSQYLSFHAFFAVNPNYADVSLKDAGSSKWTNRPGVYDSGVAAAFCLDGVIRESSQDERDLADLMRLMNERYGRTGDFYVYDDLVAAASETAGADLSAFFDAHIAGKDRLPVAECAALMGYAATVDGYHVMLRPLED